MALSKREREEFLTEPHVAALSIVEGHGRGPLTVPVWYQYTPGGEPWVLMTAGSRKVRAIEAAGRFTLMVDRVEPTVRYVSVEGPVAGTLPGAEEHMRELAARYLPAEKVAGYVEFSKAEHGEQVVYIMRPERWLSSDLGGW